MSTETIAALAGSFAGELVAPGDRAYDEARAVWNGPTGVPALKAGRVYASRTPLKCATT